MGYAGVWSGMVILILAAIISGEGLFSETRRTHAEFIPAIGLGRIGLGIVHILYPAVLVAVAGDLVGGAVTAFGGIMVFLAASIIFSEVVRAIVMLASLCAIILGSGSSFRQQQPALRRSSGSPAPSFSCIGLSGLVRHPAPCMAEDLPGGYAAGRSRV